MRNVRAVILELQGRRAVVLAEDGSFRRVRVPAGAAVGETIALSARRVPVWSRPLAVAVAAAVLLAAAVPLVLLDAQRAEAFAVVSLDVGTSVEIAVDNQGRFLDVVAADPDAAPIAERLKALRGRPAEEAVAAALRAAMDLGVLDGGQQDAPPVILVVAASADDPDKQALAEQLRAQAEARVRAEVAAAGGGKADAPAEKEPDVASGLLDPTLRAAAAERGLTVAAAVEVLAQRHGVDAAELLAALRDSKNLGQALEELRKLGDDEIHKHRGRDRDGGSGKGGDEDRDKDRDRDRGGDDDDDRSAERNDDRRGRKGGGSDSDDGGRSPGLGTGSPRGGDGDRPGDDDGPEHRERRRGKGSGDDRDDDRDRDGGSWRRGDELDGDGEGDDREED